MTEPKLSVVEGIARFPFLNTPNLRYGRGGTYSVRLNVTAENAAPLIAAIDTAAQEMFSAKKNAASAEHAKRITLAEPPYVLELNGSYNFQIKERTERKDRKGKLVRFKPDIFDAEGRPTPRTKIGDGSLLRVSFLVAPYFTLVAGAGVTLRLKGVQILNLVAPVTPRDPAYFGFNDETVYDRSRFVELGFTA